MEVFGTWLLRTALFHDGGVPGLFAVPHKAGLLHAMEKSTGCCRVVKNSPAVVAISSMGINTGGEKHPNG